MNIALMAHDRKKELMVQFCIAYCGILSLQNLCATNTTGRLVTEATGLPINLYLSCSQGGDEQIGARISYNELDMVLYFADPSESAEALDSVNTISRLCDQQNVPFATNGATAEVLIRGLQDGFLDWRNIVNPKE